MYPLALRCYSLISDKHEHVYFNGYYFQYNLNVMTF